jgi:hypothetical protein
MNRDQDFICGGARLRSGVRLRVRAARAQNRGLDLCFAPKMESLREIICATGLGDIPHLAQNRALQADADIGLAVPDLLHQMILYGIKTF